MAESFKEKSAAYQRQYTARIRNQVIDMLGDKCVECGCDDRRALEIDHIDGGGSKENRELGPGRYKKYLKNGGKGLQLLCANCNAIKKREKKEFPNKKYEESTVKPRWGHRGAPPNPHAKVSQVILRARTKEEETKIKGVKEICRRNNLMLRDVMMEGIEKFLRKHNWPPGNSQTVLETFNIKPQISIPTCGIRGCSEPAAHALFHENITIYRCRTHKFFQLPWSTYGSMPIKKFLKI